MTKREIERRAALLLARYQRARDIKTPIKSTWDQEVERKAHWIGRMSAVLELAEELGCKRARIVAAVQKQEAPDA